MEKLLRKTTFTTSSNSSTSIIIIIILHICIDYYTKISTFSLTENILPFNTLNKEKINVGIKNKIK